MATFYVAPAASGGNNSNPGTIGSPKLTIAAGIGLMASNAGDILYIRAGTYAEKIDSNVTTMPTGTTYANGPTISAYPGETVTLQHNNLVLHLPGGTGLQFMTFQNLIFDGLNLADNVIGMGSTGSHDIRILNCEAKNAGHILVIWHYPGHHYIFSGGSVHDVGNTTTFPRPANRHYGFYVETSDNIVENAEIYNTNDFGIHNYSGLDQSSRNIYRNNTLHHNSLLDASGAAIIMAVSDAGQVYNNVVYSSSGHGIEIYTDGTDNEVYNNTVYACAQNGIWLLSGGTGAIVRNNISFGNSGTPIQNSATGTTLSNNQTTDPSFVNVGTNDFHLQSGSTARDAGFDLTSAGITTDKDGIARPQGSAFDIGAYEFVTGAPTNPTLPLIDTFTDTNGTLLPAHNANWVAVYNNLEINGNQARSSVPAGGGTAPTGLGMCTWNTISPTEYMEAYATMTAKAGAANWMSLFLRLTTTAGGTMDGYAAQFNDISGAGNDEILIYRMTNGAYTALGTTVISEFTAGDVFLFTASGNTLKVYQNGTLMKTETDSTYPNAGRVGLDIYDQTGRWDDFGGMVSRSCLKGLRKT